MAEVERDGSQQAGVLQDGIKLTRIKHIDSQSSVVERRKAARAFEGGQLNMWRESLPPLFDGTLNEPEQYLRAERRSMARSESWRKLQIRGTALLSYNIRSVRASSSAGRAAFVQENYGAAKSLYHYSSVTLEGPILGKLRVRAQFNTPSYSPMSNTFVLEYPMGNLLLRYGDMNLSIVGNRFASLSRWTRGFEIRYSLDGKAEKLYGIGGGLTDGSELVIVTAEGKSQVKRDVIQGNNTSGPFFLSSSPIVEGSEQVLVDMRKMKRGEDYQIDYDTGMLTFLGATVIPPTSTIIVTYEAAQPCEGIGRFWGARLNWRGGERYRFGFSFLTQGAAQRRGDSNSVKRREEFLGANTVGPFQLSQRPIVEGSEVVTVNGVPQERNRDYIINYISGLVTFVRPVPTGAIVAVEYLQRASRGAIVGQHSVIGFDANISLGRTGEVDLQLARSSGPARSGMAVEVASRLSFGSLNDGTKRTPEKRQQSEEAKVSSQPAEPNASSVKDAFESGIETSNGDRLDVKPEPDAQPKQGGNVRGASDDEAFKVGDVMRSRIKLHQPFRASSWNYQLGIGGEGLYGSTRASAARTELSLRMLKVTPGFARIENADFYQNESGFEAGLIHRFTRHLALTSQWVNASTSYITSAFGGSSSPTSSRRFSIALSFDKPNSPTVRLAHQRFSFGSQSGSNRYASTSALISYRKKRWSFDAAYEGNLQSYSSAQSGVRTTLYRLSFRFEPSTKLLFNADWSSNRSASGSRSISASNFLIGATFQPSSSLRLTLSHNMLSGSSGVIGSPIVGGATGAYSGLPYTFESYSIGGAYYGGVTAGLGGYGTFGAALRPITGLGGMSAIGHYGSTAGDSFGYETMWQERDDGDNSTGVLSRNRSNATMVSLDWQLGSRFSLLCHWSRQLTHGSSFIADYSSIDYGLQVGYQLSQNVTLTGQLSRQKQSFLQPNSDAFTSICGLGMQYAGRRFNASLYWNVLDSESSQQFSSEEATQYGGLLRNSFESVTLDMSYRLSKRLELMSAFVHARNRGIGGYAQNSFRIAIGYRIFEQLWLDVNAERIDRKDLVGSGGDYKATIVSLQLRGNF